MARARNIKPAIMDNEKLADCDHAARLLFVYLWMLADRSGRLEDRPRRIKVQAFPYDEIDVDRLLEQLHEQGFILRYEVSANKYIQIINFVKHQAPHVKEKESTIPAPDKVGANTVQGQDKPDTKTSLAPPDSLNEDSLNEDGGPPAAPPSKRGSRLPDKWELPNEFYSEAQALKPNWSHEKIKITGDAFRDYWIAKPGNQGVKRDWLATWRNWVRRDWDTSPPQRSLNGHNFSSQEIRARKAFPFGSQQ